MNIILSSYLLVALITLFQIATLVECGCKQSGNILSCKDKPAEDSKILAGEQLAKYYLENIQNIKLKSYLNVNKEADRSLQSFYFVSSDLESIDQQYFAKISNGKLQYLEFKDTEIKKKLTRRHFLGVANSLKVLILDNGPDYEADAFDDLTQLKVLKIMNTEYDVSPAVLPTLLKKGAREIIIENTKIANLDISGAIEWARTYGSQRFSLKDSPLHCDSSMELIREIMTAEDVVSEQLLSRKLKNFVCASPESVKGRSLSSFSEKELAELPKFKPKNSEDATIPEKPKPKPTPKSEKKNTKKEEEGKPEKEKVGEEENIKEEKVEDQKTEDLEKSGKTTQPKSASLNLIGIVVVIGLAILVMGVCLGVFVCCRKKKEQNEYKEGQDPEEKTPLSQDP